MAISAEDKNFLVSLYVGYFNRAPDPAGLQFWIDQVEAGRDTNTIAADFAASPEAKSLYPFLTTPDVSSPTSFITAVYANLFNRAPDAAGQAFWEAQLSSGAVSPADAIDAIIKGATTAPDSTVLSNKIVVGLDFATDAGNTPGFTFDLNGASGNAAKDAISGVTEDAATVTAAQAATDAYLSDASNPGQSFTLTTNQDTLTGTASNDTFVAGVSGDTQGNNADTLQNFDAIDGGAGTDTLSATLNTNTLVTPSLSNIENVELRVTSAGGDIDFTASTGIQSITVANSTAATGVIDKVGSASLAVKNQNTAVSFNGQTSTTLGLAFDTVGVVSATAPTEVAVDIGAGTASKATTLNITSNASNVEVLDTTGANVATTATIAATGANQIKLTDGLEISNLTTTGAGSVDLSEVDLVKVATLTAGDGGITFTTGDSTATTFNATTGAGKDTLTIDGDNTAKVSTGGGDDKVTVGTAALAATATVELGDGNDSLIFGATGPAAGATLTGGAGTDTLSIDHAEYVKVAAFSAANLAKITGFESLTISDVLADTDVVDLSKVSGLVSAEVAGVAAGGNASITNIGAGAAVTIKGDLDTDTGGLTVALADATGTADTLNLTLNDQFTENNDATATVEATNAFTVTATGIENLNVTSAGTPSTAFLGATGNKADGVQNTLTLTNNDLTNLVVSGDQAFSFLSAAGMTKLASVNASALDTVTGTGATIDVSAAATNGSAAAITITGSADADVITGSGNADTISGGAGNDTITGGAKADALSGGAGNDIFVMTSAEGDGSDSTLVNLDVISDFSANTFGNGANGAAGTGAGAVASRTGDVLQFDVSAAVATDGAVVSVQANASDAQTFLQNLGASADAATDNAFGAALDSTTGRLYVDLNSDGTVDSVIELTGVTTIDAAAFVLV